MPYITEERRRSLMRGYPDKMENAGELNWEISELIKRYIVIHGNSYITYNDVVGALECAKQEFYRRVLIPYEEIKIKTNGDIY
jgi:hypothetical protein